MITSFVPILSVDVLGSVAMVILSILALYKAWILRSTQPDNEVFLYLLWISTGFCVFAISRSFGHILRQFLVLSGNADTWYAISAYSGSVNTVSFMIVSLITLFFHQSWRINEKILSGQKELENTHVQLMELNQTLEQKVIERTERLTSSEHKCRRIFEQSLDTIIVTDDDFKVLEINPAGIELTGYSRDQMIMDRMKVSDFFSTPAEWEQLFRKIETEEYVLNEEVEFLRPDKLKIKVMITGGIDYGAFGCAKSHHFIIKNINDKKLMEQQIAQADKLAALGELSAGVAHEINNPLGVILGYTQLMLKQDSVYSDDLKIIEKHVKSCKTVVSDLLSFSRKGAAAFRRIDINLVLAGVVKFLANHSDFRDMNISLDLYDETPMPLIGSEQELSQVFVNLLINACHACDKKGTILVRTRKPSDAHILIEVEDNGKGIRKRDMAKIFDPFFTTKPVGQGTGLGLSVGYGIIKRHQGCIDVKNNPGKGCMFSITLPAAQAENIQTRNRPEEMI